MSEKKKSLFISTCKNKRVYLNLYISKKQPNHSENQDKFSTSSSSLGLDEESFESPPELA